MTSAPGWAWPVVICVILVLLTIDLLASRRPGISRAALISAAWLGAGVAFGLILSVWQGARSGEQYFAAYALEKALSVGNLVVFAMLFRAFAAPVASQHRVLLAGVAGALVLRGGIIATAAGLSMLARRRAAARAEVPAAEPTPVATDMEEVRA